MLGGPKNHCDCRNDIAKFIAYGLRCTGVFFGVALATMANCSAAAVLGDTMQPAGHIEILTEIPLDHVDVDGRDSIRLRFSSDSKFICASWQSVKVRKEEGKYVRVPFEFRIFDLSAKELASSRGQTSTQVITNFPDIAWHNEIEAFRTNEAKYLFDASTSLGIRVFEISALSDVRVECWKLPLMRTNSPVWVRQMQREFGCAPIAVTQAPDAGIVFETRGGKELLILDKVNGQTLRRFPIGHIETDKEAAERKRKFGLGFDLGDPALTFSSHAFSYDDRRHLMACGAFHDKRLRVIDLLKPDNPVFEANADVNPARPRGGFWKVERVEFASIGKYLIAGYNFGGRGTTLSINSTEIFDTSGKWKRVWHEEDLQTGSVTLSPDGRLLAYIRNNAIEIVQFVPK